VWSFDTVGELYYYQQANLTECETYNYNDVLILGSTHISAPHRAAVYQSYDLKALKPYESRYLIRWAAELPQISALMATDLVREEIFAELKTHIPSHHRHALLHKRVYLESVKLILVPVWLAQYRYQTQRYQIIINGQTGVYYIAQPNFSWWQRWWYQLF
jgi:hypothetical protein